MTTLAPAIAFFVACSAACSLTSQGTPLEIRYFSPERPEDAAASAKPAGTRAAALRVGRITSSANLRYRIVHRDSDFELGEYDALRWTENPEAYVRRSLLHALFEEQPLEQAVSGPLPTLDVEVIAFEEVRHGPSRAGHVELRYELHDDRAVLASGVVRAERRAAGEGIEPVVAAIALAMGEATSKIGGTVAARLKP